MAKILTTGANRGIGLELCTQWRARGDEIIAACRESSAALDALGVRVEAGIDVGDAGAGAELAKRLGGAPLDVLINNAGIFLNETIEAIDFATIEKQVAVNALGPLRITSALLGSLGRGAKVAIITSRMGSMGDNSSGAYYGYRMSKAAVNAAGVSLARDLAPRGVAVGLFHPGMVATDMTGRHGIPPADSAAGLITRIDALSLETSGKFIHAVTGEELPW